MTPPVISVVFGITLVAIGAGITYLIFVQKFATIPTPIAALINRNTHEDELGTYCTNLTKSSNRYVGTQQRVKLMKELQNPSSQSSSWIRDVHLTLARDYLRLGEVDKSVALLQQVLDTLEPYGPEAKQRTIFLEALVVAYLKMGELDNCLSPTGSLICALPLDTSMIHRDRAGSGTAIEYLTQWLDLEPDNIKARWLLNIAHMTLGTYPEKVPDQFLISPDKLINNDDIERFDQIAPRVGIYAIDLAGGSIIEDFDNDGWLDIMSSTWDPCGTIKYYHNDGTGQFSDYTSRVGLESQLGGLNIAQTDYDNDGWMDVLVMRGGWMKLDGQMRVSLLRNNKGQTFSDVTHQVGLAHPAYPSQSAQWADFDNDGDLDLFSCNESMPEGIDGVMFPSQLFQNDNNGSFTDIARQAGLGNFRYCKGSAWGDYDNDGDQDLYVSNFRQENRLYQNEGDGTFIDVAFQSGVSEPIDSFSTWFWDYDNDGWLDLFVAGYGSNIVDVGSDYLGIPNNGARPRLYRNTGTGKFTDVTLEAGLYRVHLTMGANFGDIDYDGFPDFYLGTGYPSYDAIGPNIMYRNNKGETFTDVTFPGGFGHLQKGHGIAFGDVDRDGDQDIFVQIGGFYPGDGFANALYENPGHANHWISVKLVGEVSNRAAIGARIKVVLKTEDGTRPIHVNVSTGGSFGASSMNQEIGLGQAQNIKTLSVYWPASGITQTFTDVPMDTHIEIRESDPNYIIHNFP